MQLLIASGLVPGIEFIYLTKPSYQTRITVLLPTPTPPPIYRYIGSFFIVLKQCRVCSNTDSKPGFLKLFLCGGPLRKSHLFRGPLIFR